MELIFELIERPSSQIKELRLLSENGNIGVYKVFCKWSNAPEFDSYLRILYSDDDEIDGLDFDGGPIIYPGYKLDKNNTITKIYRDKITNEFLVEVKCTKDKIKHMKKEKYYYGEDLRRAIAMVTVNSKNMIVNINSMHTYDNIPRVTICGIYDNIENTMSYGVAKCSEQDNFSRKMGQRISYSRALKCPYRIVHIQPEDKISKLFITHAKDIEKEVLKYYNKKLNG